MDGPEGERHVEWGARVAHDLLDRPRCHPNWLREPYARRQRSLPEATAWYDFCLYHSRFRAKQDGAPHSRLCVADKLSVAMEPWWLYLPRVIASGEVWEYMALAGGKNNSKYRGEPNTKYVSMALATGTVRGWHRAMTAYLWDWAMAHRDGREDTWTPTPKGAAR